jgi:hypothetical protein
MHNEELNNYSSDVVKKIKSRKIRWGACRPLEK